MQGIVFEHQMLPLHRRCELYVPPLLRNLQYVPSVQGNPLHIHQSITITGFSEPTFDASINSLIGVYAEFAQYAVANSISPWTSRSVQVADNDHKVFTFTNPVFMTRKAMQNRGDVTEIKVDEGLDPHHHLPKQKSE